MTAGRIGLAEALLASYADVARELRPASLRTLAEALLWRSSPRAPESRLVGEALLPILRLVGRTWWRLSSRGLEQLPRDGGALLVTSTRDPAAPWEAAAILAALSEHLPDSALVRTAIDPQRIDARPLAGWLRGLGAVPARAGDVIPLLRAGEMVVVPVPLDASGATSPVELQRWAEIGRRGEVPVLPVRVRGADRSHPGATTLRGWLDGVGAVGVPASVPAVLLGMAGLIGLPGRWEIEISAAVRLEATGAGRRTGAEALAEALGTRQPPGRKRRQK